MADENKVTVAADKAYDDRLTAQSDEALPMPQIEIIVDGNSVFKPGMKTLFVDDYGEEDSDYHMTVVGTYCSCDTVVSRHYTVCTCNPVCTCESNCSCHGYSSSSKKNSGGSSGGRVSCGSPCACVPVH